MCSTTNLVLKKASNGNLDWRKFEWSGDMGSISSSFKEQVLHHWNYGAPFDIWG